MKRTRALIPIFTVIIVLLASCATKMPALSTEEGAPLSITDYEKIAQTERDNRRYENAVRAYEALIANYPDNVQAVAWANYEIGFCYFVVKRYDEAEKYFRIVINEFQEPAARKLAQDMLAKIAKIVEEKKK
jgi:TolA-binding protein